MHYCISNRKGSITGVRATRKRLVYGIFQVQIPGSITILLEGNTAGSIEKHIGYFVINEIIKEAASTAAILDFAGTSDRSAIPKGESFGAVNVPYYRIYRNRLFWPARIMNNSKPVLMMIPTQEMICWKKVKTIHAELSD